MVSYSDVLANNSSLKSSSGLVAVFVGATAGIGLGALRALAKHTDAPTVFVVGRSEATLNKIIDELRTINSTGTYHPIQADDLTLLANVNKACEAIKSLSPSKIDILCLSPGYLTFASRSPSSEGLDKITSIRFYARMLFLVNLLPLLRASPSPRVISVLAGGQEGQLWPDDFPLEKHYSIAKAAGASASMTTFFLEELSKQPENEKIVFVHLFPGLVTDTGLSQTEHFGAVTKFLLGWILLPLLKPFGYTSQEVGERVLFAATTRSFQRLDAGASAEEGVASKRSNEQSGSGIYLVQADSSTVEAPKIFREMREQGIGQKLYDHTMEEFARIGGK